MIEQDEIETLPVVAESLPPADMQAGIIALSEMGDHDFEVRMIAMRRGRDRLARIHQELMSRDDDYGVIPGTNKPTLLKPGAEKLASFYRLATSIEHSITYASEPNQPPITVLAVCNLHAGTLDGPVVNTGHGAANSWEKRYRYRRGERACPNCGVIGAIIKGKAEYGGGWICFAKKGGCGAKFSENAPEIVNQPLGDVENPDPYDLLNTLLKMASKRSFVDAVLRATATSSLYTQDMEEFSAPPNEPPRQAQRDEEESVTERPLTPRAVGNGHSQPAPEPAEGAAICQEPGCDVALTPGQRTISLRKYGGAFCLQHQQGRPVTTTIG